MNSQKFNKIIDMKKLEFYYFYRNILLFFNQLNNMLLLFENKYFQRECYILNETIV